VPPPARRQVHLNLLELLPLLRRENFLDLGVRGVQLGADLRPDAGHDRVDPHMMLVDDALDIALLLRGEVQLAIEMIDDPARREFRHPPPGEEPAVMKKVKAIAGDAGEQPANERDDDHHCGGRPRATRRRD